MKKILIMFIIGFAWVALPGAIPVVHAAVGDPCTVTISVIDGPAPQYQGKFDANNNCVTTAGSGTALQGQTTNASGQVITPTSNTSASAASPTPTPAQPCGTTCNLSYTPLEPIPGFTVNTSGKTLDFPNLLGNLYIIAITIGALFSVLMLTISGIRYMLSDVVTDKARAKTRIVACIYGLVLIAGSWLILHTINPKLLEFDLNPGTGTISGSQTIVNSGSASQTAQLSSTQQAQTGAETNNVLLIDTSTLSGASSAMQTFSSNCPAGTVVSSALPGTLAGGSANQSAFVCTTPNAGQVSSQAMI